MKILSLLCLLFCLLACNQAENENASDSQNKADSLKVTKEDISKLNFIEFVLDEKAEKLFENWTSYSDLDNHISDLKQGDISFFKENPELLNALLKDFKETLPEQINSPAILARIKELETKIYKLQSIANITNGNKNALYPVIKELLISFSNFNLQINKKFEKESQNIQKP
jgi:hypothetical protein